MLRVKRTEVSSKYTSLLTAMDGGNASNVATVASARYNYLTTLSLIF
jgi:hypothetical protein